MRIALVSREVHPLIGGGIGTYVSAVAELLSQSAEVTILTTSALRDRYEKLLAEDDKRLPSKRVRLEFVVEPEEEEVSGWYDVMHLYSARVLERLRELYPDGGPDLIEFPDFLAEGFVTVQAAQALDRFLRETCICVRTHTSAEMTEVLNGYYHGELPRQVLYAMERYALNHADRLLWQGGEILGTYGRFYRCDRLAPAARVRSPYPARAPEAAPEPGYHAASPLKLLYLGRLERRKGVQNLIRALTASERQDFRLTLLGGDTPTAPLGLSMREQLELEIADDPRIRFSSAASEDPAIASEMTRHDLVVLPSLWECWPYVGLEALHLNRPMLAAPVGGLVEMVRPGVTGWLARGSDPPALQEAVEEILDGGRALLEHLITENAPAEHGRALADGSEILSAYEQIAALSPRRRLSRPSYVGPPPLVSAVVPYFRSARFVRETIESLRGQTYPRIEIILVNDGSFGEDDLIVAELAARVPVTVVSQMNQGLGAARNFGISQSQGRYIFPLDADNLAEPTFVARCVEILEHRPEVAYVTSWSRYIQEDGTPRPGSALGYQPLGNQAPLVDQENVAGDAAAVIRRRIFDAGFSYSEELSSYEDWHFYRELRRAGHLGTVIPERLLRYRVHQESMQAQIAQPRRVRLEGEIEALLRENGMRWSSSG